jgi:hypothetical protein
MIAQPEGNYFKKKRQRQSKGRRGKWEEKRTSQEFSQTAREDDQGRVRGLDIDVDKRRPGY